MIEYAVGCLMQIPFGVWKMFASVSIVILVCDFILWKILKKNYNRVTPFIFVYLFFILIMTLLSREPGSEMKYELTVFWSWREVFVNGQYYLMQENFLNIILFVPFGFLLGIRKIKIRTAALFSFLLSFIIESTQLIFHLGLFEWDDMIHNTLGGLLGVVIWYIIFLIFQKMKKICSRKSAD